jgi:hypothetical protein
MPFSLSPRGRSRRRRWYSLRVCHALYRQAPCHSSPSRNHRFRRVLNEGREPFERISEAELGRPAAASFGVRGEDRRRPTRCRLLMALWLLFGGLTKSRGSCLALGPWSRGTGDVVQRSAAMLRPHHTHANSKSAATARIRGRPCGTDNFSAADPQQLTAASPLCESS